MLSKKNRLTKRGSFTYLYKNGKSHSDNLQRLFFVRGSGLKIGFSVSNKLGKATARNKIKRRMRAAVRELLFSKDGAFVTNGVNKANGVNGAGGCQLVFLAKNDIAGAEYNQIKASAARLLTKAGLLEKQG